MDRDRYSGHRSDGSTGQYPLNVEEADRPLRVETLDSEQEYRVDQFGKAIVGPGGFGEFGLGPKGDCKGDKIKETVLTYDDLRILRECNKESFYKRCLPLGLAGNLLVYLYNQNKPPGNRRGWMTYFGVTMFAWMAGKMSYRSQCEDKLIASGHQSKLVGMLRQRRGVTPSELDSDQGWQSNSSSDWKLEDHQQSRQSSADLSLSSGHESSSGTESEEGGSVTYDYLRQQNRSRSQTPSSLHSSPDALRSKPNF